MATVTTTAVIGAVPPGVPGGTTPLLVPTNMKAKLKSITIDNQGVGAHTIHFREVSTPDPYDGVAAPVTLYLDRGQYSVPAGITAVIDKNALQGREFLEQMNVWADATEPLCAITVDYDLE